MTNVLCQAQLGSSAKNEEVGRIVLDQLCPAVHAVLLDGLRTHVRSFFGKVKNTAWKVVEDSIDMGKLFELSSTATTIGVCCRRDQTANHIKFPPIFIYQYSISLKSPTPEARF